MDAQTAVKSAEGGHEPSVGNQPRFFTEPNATFLNPRAADNVSFVTLKTLSASVLVQLKHWLAKRLRFSPVQRLNDPHAIRYVSLW